jgi:hypothetical protein
MAIQLILDDDPGIPIPVDDFVREAWAVQFGRATTANGVEQLYDRLAQCFVASLAECLDADLKLPTDAQIRYATDISRDLGVALPPRHCAFEAQWLTDVSPVALRRPICAASNGGYLQFRQGGSRSWQDSTSSDKMPLTSKRAVQGNSW